MIKFPTLVGSCYSNLKVMLFGLPTVKLIPLALLLTYVATLPSVISVLVSPESPIGGPGWGKQDVFRMILFGCVLAPLLETAFHQWACLRILQKLRCRASVAILVSSAVFGLAHDYSIPYMATAFLGGVVLSTVFVIESKRNGHPFLATLTVHALRNWITTTYILLV
ncbi:CPBP family intramembrane glutamic endopeptidase [Paraburkholderia lacunae]|nr:CPBP family intramembrane glutamic endopeptidase [Paraburkholderia lacunae]